MSEPPSIQDGASGAAPSPIRNRRRGWFWPAALLFCLVLFAGWFWRQRHPPAPAPPTLDLTGADPEIVAAIEKERQRVIQSPRSASAWGKLGELLGEFSYRRSALECLTQAERLDPKEPRWPYHQGFLLLLEHPDEAVEHLRRAVELCGDRNLAPRIRLSETLLTLGRLDEAEEGFHLVQERHPGNGRAALGLGRIALQRGQWTQAQSCLDAAVVDRYCTREATRALAKLRQNLGDHEGAAQLFHRVESLPLDPPWPDSYLDEIPDVQLGKRARLVQIDQLILQGRAQEALPLLNNLTAEYPDAVEVWFALGQLLHRCGAYPQAERAMAKTVALAPGYASAYNFLGAAQLGQGKLADAEIALRKAIELKPDFAHAYVTLGRCLLQRKDTDGAIAAFRAAIRGKPEFVAARIELAELLHQTHRDAEALAEVRAALQLNPGDERAKQLLAKLESKPQS